MTFLLQFYFTSGLSFQYKVLENEHRAERVVAVATACVVTERECARSRTRTVTAPTCEER